MVVLSGFRVKPHVLTGERSSTARKKLAASMTERKAAAYETKALETSELRGSWNAVASPRGSGYDSR